MKTVRISEFRENLAQYLKNVAPLAIARRGETVAFWLPIPPKRTDEEWAEFDRAAARVERFVAELEMTEDEIVEDFEKWRASQKREER